jgi:adenylylsulfate kinase
MNDRQCAPPEGTVWWITGMSGAGKTSVAQLVQQGLRRRGRAVLLLDGDVLRAVLGSGHGHGRDDRLRLAMTYARLAREVARQGIDAVCATISMFHDVRQWNRDNIPRYREVYLRVPAEELHRRDPRGLYAGARHGKTADMVGIDLRAEEPASPDLVIDNFGEVTPELAAARILDQAEAL